MLASTGSTPSNYLFAGEQFDPNLGLYYNRARYLDVRSGRFSEMDTYEGEVEAPYTLNKFAYSYGNPVDVVDPSGNDGMAELSMAFSISETINSISIPQFNSITRSALLDIAGVQACIRPLTTNKKLGPFGNVPRHWKHTYIKILDPAISMTMAWAVATTCPG